MRRTAVVIAPGRGTYNRQELGYLARHHSDVPFLREFDAYRVAQGQPTLADLDGAARFSKATHLRGDNASALIYACAFADFMAIDRDKFDIVGVTGNSMGWYIALACACALDPMAGFSVANTMGRLMHEHMIGGQLIYPMVDEKWCKVPGRRENLLATVAQINAAPDKELGISIDLGGMLVFAGNEAGLAAFEKTLEPIDGRFPLRLPGHAAFHTDLQKPVSDLGLSAISVQQFRQPKIPLIDGRGASWLPYGSSLRSLHTYTLDHQVTKTYDYGNHPVRTAVTRP